MDRCVLEVDLNIIRHNYLSARALSGADVIPVVKANAYGLGAAEVSRALADAGARLFAVAELGEAMEVMTACARPALILGLIPDELIETALAAGAQITIADMIQARLISSIAARMGVVARAHLKIDTGLHRLGFEPRDLLVNSEEIFSLSNLKIEGVYTHLALRSAENDARQLALFTNTASALSARGYDVGIRHALDSIAMVKYPDFALDAVRAGAWIFGNFHPSFGDPARCPQTMKLSARIMQLRAVAAGECLGYDDSHPLARDSVVATVSIGYCDGLPRACDAGWAVVRGTRARIVGLVCMDSLTLDVTDVPGVKPGDMATFIGEGITPLEAATWYGVNRNELVARTSSRVRRVYK